MKTKIHTTTSSLSKSDVNRLRQIEVIRLMKLHYRAIRMRLQQPYTDAFEVALVLMRLNLLLPEMGLSTVRNALTSHGLMLRDKLAEGPRNVYFPLLIHRGPEDHFSLADLIGAELIEERF